MTTRKNKTTAGQQLDQRLASWIFGSLLLLLAMALMLWGPESLPLYKQRLLGFLCSLLAGLFTYFLIGAVSFLPHKIPVKASGGIAVFLIVLWWWSSPNAPIKVVKITPSILSASVRFNFMHEPNPKDAERFAHLITDDTILTLRFSSTSFEEPPQRWSARPLSQQRQRTEVTVRSANQKGTIERFPTVDGVEVVPNRRFDVFTGSLGLFENSEAWKDAHLQAILESKADDVEALRYYEQLLDEYLRKEFDEHYRISTSLRTIWEDSDYSVVPLPIRAAIEVYVAGKPVWRAEGWLAKVWEHDEDVRLLIVARFPSSPISAVPSGGHGEGA